MTWALTVAGAPKVVRHRTLTLSETLNGRTTLGFEIVDEAGAYRPAKDAALLLSLDAAPKFGGTVEIPNERALTLRAGIVTAVDALDYSAFLDRIYVTKTYAAGQTALQVITDIWTTYLAAFGFTLDPLIDDGPTLDALTYDGTRTVGSIYDEICVVAGWVRTMSPTKVISAYTPGDTAHGAPAPPFAITDADMHFFGDLTITPVRDGYANRIILRYGQGERWVMREPHAGNGVTRTFVLSIPASTPPNIVWQPDGVTGLPVGVYGVDDMAWTFETSTNTLHQRISETVIGVGEFIWADYLAAYPGTVIVEDVSALTAPREKPIQVPDCFDTAWATTLATGYLAQAMAADTSRVQLTSRDAGWQPGQVVSIQNTRHNFNSSCLVTDVQTRDVDGATTTYTVTAVAGSVYPGSWRDLLKQQMGGGGGSSAASTASVGAPPWVSVGPEWFTPQKYGTIQATITAALAAGGGRVYVKPGTYNEGDLTILADPKLEIITDGWRVTIIQHTGSGDIIKILPNVADGTYDGFRFAGFTLQGGANSQNGVSIENAHLTRIEDVRIKDVLLNGVKARNAYVLWVSRVYSMNATGHGILIDGTGGAIGNAVSLRNCGTYGSGGDGIAFQGVANGSLVEGCYSEDNALYGLRVSGPGGVQVHGGCNFERNLLGHILAEGDCRAVRITGNWFFAQTPTAIPAAIGMAAARTVTIEGNIAIGPHTAFVALYSGADDVYVGPNASTGHTDYVSFLGSPDPQNVRIARCVDGIPYDMVLAAHNGVIPIGGSRSQGFAVSAWTRIPNGDTFIALDSGPYLFRGEIQTTAAGTTAQARLYDVTAAAQVTNSPTTPTAATTWEEFSQLVTLIKGHRYIPEMVGSDALAEVMVGQAEMVM